MYYLKILVYLLLICLANCQTKDTRCIKTFNNDASVDLTPLKKETNYSYIFNGNNQDNSTIYYNFCNYTQYTCPDHKGQTYALLKSSDQQLCFRLTGDQVYNDLKMELIDENQPTLGIQIKIDQGDKYNDDQNYAIQFIILCVANELNPFVIHNISQIDNIFLVYGQSQYACPDLILSAIWELLQDYTIVCSLGLILIGLVVCFFGQRVTTISLLITGFFTGFGFLLAILGEFVLEPDANRSTVVVVTLIILIFGLLLGYITTIHRKMGTFMLGMWTGIILDMLMYESFLYKLEGKDGSKSLTLWISVFTVGSAFGILGFFIQKHITIISTSFIGSYLIIRPFGWFVGHWPNEFTLVKQIKYKLVNGVPNEFYLFLALVFVVTGIGIKFQYWLYFRARKRQKLKEEQDQLEMGDLEGGLEDNLMDTSKDTQNKKNQSGILSFFQDKFQRSNSKEQKQNASLNTSKSKKKKETKAQSKQPTTVKGKQKAGAAKKKKNEEIDDQVDDDEDDEQEISPGNKNKLKQQESLNEDNIQFSDEDDQNQSNAKGKQKSDDEEEQEEEEEEEQEEEEVDKKSKKKKK